MQAAQSVSDSDLKITPAHLDNSAPVGSTIGSCSPGSDLRNSLHAMSSSRRDEPPLNSHQPCMIFSSSCTASDPERGFAGAGWSPRCYACSFCGREFNSAQALGGHMNIHRRDRARLRTSTSPTSAPHQADLPPIPQNTPQYSAGSSLYHPFEAAPFTKNPTAISSSLSAYTAPTIISASPAFRLLEMHSAADPTLLTLVAHPSQAENPAPSLSARSLLDLSPFCSNRSSANRFRKAQSESQTSFPDIAPHASPLLLRPSLENSSLKHVDALNTRARQASSWQVSLDHCSAAKAAGGAQVIQLGKRPRVDAQDAAIISSDGAKSRVERCDDRSSTSISSTSEKSNPLDAAAEAPRSYVQPPSNIKGVLCLDLELRLGRSSASDSRASTAGGCSVRKTAPRQSEKSLR